MLPKEQEFLIEITEYINIIDTYLNQIQLWQEKVL